MPWYTWVFSGVGAVFVVPAITWVLARVHRPPASTALPAGGQGAVGVSPTPPAAIPKAAPPSTAAPVATPVNQSDPAKKALIEYLVDIPEMQDPVFRQLLYVPLPASVAHQLQIGNRTRIDLISLIDTFSRYPQLRPWQALQDRMSELLPDNPAVERLAAELARLGFIDSR